ncbi:MAG: hypothetical protein LBR38_07950 [Synergistaceae bacterium]|nr:hypothetical protein [Synergistaceae bacterium]
MFNYYLEESRVGHDDVVRLFEAIAAGVHKGYTSHTVVRELRNAPHPKRDNMLGLVDKYGVTLLAADDIIVSYNFQHINRQKTKKLTSEVNRREGYGGVVICTAEEVLNYGNRFGDDRPIVVD